MQTQVDETIIAERQMAADYQKEMRKDFKKERKQYDNNNNYLLNY